jgi:hypothetical protein
MTKTERDKIVSELRRAKAYAEQAEEMLIKGQPRQFRCDIKTAKDSLDLALATFIHAEDKEQTS